MHLNCIPFFGIISHAMEILFLRILDVDGSVRVYAE